MMQRWRSQSLQVPRDPSAPWVRADLEFEGVEHDGASFVVHVFLNNPEADEAAVQRHVAANVGPDELRDGYAGYLTVFAHGDCWGDVGHCEVKPALGAFDRRPPHPLVPFNATLEITQALKALPDDPGEITVTTLAFDARQSDDDVLRFNQLTLLTYR